MSFDLILKIADTIGMVGVVIVLYAYFLLMTNRIDSFDIRYQMYNLIGAGCILFSLFYAWNLASVIIEAAWMVISLIGIVRWYRGIK